MATLHAKRILIVEDEPMIAMLLEEMVLDEGGLIVGPAANLDRPLALARDEANDAALLDVTLGGARSDALADVLLARGIPIIVATGHGDGAGRGAHAGAPVIGKPYRLDEMAARIANLVSVA